MTPTISLVIGLVVGGVFAAIIFFLSKRGSGTTAGSEIQAELIRRLETLDRGLRDEFSRNREEGATVAKNQREELTKSLEGVRSIVDLRLKKKKTNTKKKKKKKSQATVDEKLQGTLETRVGESFKLVSDRLEQVHKGLG